MANTTASVDQIRITDSNLSPAIQICAVIFVVPIIFGVGGRIFTKVAVLKQLKLDDYAILAAFAFSIGQTSTVLVAAANGLGQPWETLSISQQERFQKSNYASGILLIVSLVLTKLSVVLFVQSLCPGIRITNLGFYISGGLIAWGLGSGIALLFQCSVPNVWKEYDNKCFDISSFWIAFGAINILSDAILIIWPAALISQVKTTRWRRAIIIMSFGCRIFVIGAIIAQIVFLRQVREWSDLSLDPWKLAICTQLMQCLSVITACVPYLRPFLDSLESGMLRIDDLRRLGQSGTHGYGSRKGTSTTKISGTTSRTRTYNRMQRSTDDMPLRPGEPLHSTEVQAGQQHVWRDPEVPSPTGIHYSTSYTVA